METEEIKKIIRDEYQRIGKEVLKKTEVPSATKEFTKIGVKLKDPLNIPNIPRMISLGERDWVIESILNLQNIQRIPLEKEKNITYSILTNLDYSGGTILIPAKLYFNLIDRYSSITFQHP